MDETRARVTRLNFHHLRYFWLVAQEGHLTRTAKALRVSQSALSSQIRQLEEDLGEPLFDRSGRALVLTEAGRVAQSFADEIFRTGGELVATLQDGRRATDPLRIGAVATLSRNFQESFVKPLFTQPGIRVRLQSGTLDDLLDRLRSLQLDLVLGNRLVRSDTHASLRCREVARQEVSLVGHPGATPVRFPDDVGSVPLLLPTHDSDIRTGFDALCASLGVVPQVFAEVDDMALLRLLARDTAAVALLPSVVVRDELRSGVLQEFCVVPNLYERFYAITVQRQFPHPMIVGLLGRRGDEILER